MPSEEPTVVSGGASPPPVPDRVPNPDRIGTYRIIRVLGQGGMGIVYQAEQLEGLQDSLKDTLARATAAQLARIYEGTGRSDLAAEYLKRAWEAE